MSDSRKIPKLLYAFTELNIQANVSANMPYEICPEMYLYCIS